jgi:CheY-like chemotaxis protein
VISDDEPHLGWPLSAAGHELRAPLAVISGYAELLRSRSDEETRLEASRRILDAAERLGACIEDVLLLLAIAARELRLEPVPLPLAAVARAAVTETASARPAHALDLDVEDDELDVLGDPEQLPRLITRVLDGVCAGQPGGGRVAVRVGRRGVRAAVEIQASTWSPGEAAHLTLDTAHRLAVLHGGSLTSTEEAAGATIRLALPLAAAGERGRRVLIVDDDENLRQLLLLTLPSEGYEIVEAHDGSEALERASSAAPDLVVLDWRLPGRSGEEVLRELSREHPGLPVIVLTAEQEQSQRDIAASLGASAFLTKPFSPLELLSSVEQLLAHPRAGTRSA